MLTHLSPAGASPTRAVVLGSGGFVAAAAAAALAETGGAVETLGRADLDLTRADAGAALAERLRADDALVFIAAKAPVRTVDALRDNIAMAGAVCAALAARPVAHLIYISSDAVYAETDALVRESTPPSPSGLHGGMHLARELALRSIKDVPLAILRPSLIHGAADPHNGYGPNQFRRLAAAGKDIVLFGEGEEQRDHVWIGDIGRLVAEAARRRSIGVLNLATGRSLSFRAVAELIAERSAVQVPVVGTPRRNPIRHRHFDTTACAASFPEFRWTPLEEKLDG